MKHQLDFEKPIVELQSKLDELRKHMPKPDPSVLTLAVLRAKHPLGVIPQDLTWESWRS